MKSWFCLFCSIFFLSGSSKAHHVVRGDQVPLIYQAVRITLQPGMCVDTIVRTAQEACVIDIPQLKELIGAIDYRMFIIIDTNDISGQPPAEKKGEGESTGIYIGYGEFGDHESPDVFKQAVEDGEIEIELVFIKPADE